MSVTNVYGQVLQDPSASAYLNITVIGDSAQPVLNSAVETSNLATTLFTSTSVLTLNAFSNSSYFCSYLRPPSPLPAVDNTTGDYCPLPAGQFAFAATIPWGNNRALTTLTTRLRAVDPFSNEILCLEVSTTPLNPSEHDPYGKAQIIFWCTVALALAYWVVVGLARIASAWGRGISQSKGFNLWSRTQSAGYILASAISGERFNGSPALLRFCTPSLRDIIFHTQWCTVLAMVAVQWPTFIYPLMSETAWASLIYNVTLSESASLRWNPLSTAPYSPPSGFSDQLSDPSSVIYINPNVPNTLFTLPDGVSPGIASFAYTVGVRPQDLFGICLTLFLGIVAGTIAISGVIWLVDYVAGLISGAISGPTHHLGSANRLGARSPAFASKDVLDSGALNAQEENRSLKGREGPGISARSPRFGLSMGRKAFWKFRIENSFHGNVLSGNLVRILVLFHLPVTVLSVFQMTQSRQDASFSSIILAGFSFTIISIIIPALLVLRVHFTNTNKLYDETRTLLSLGPLYNHYRHGSQMFACLFFATNLAFGVTVGAGQKSGTAQAIIILVVEVLSALMTSLWLPWGTGASMGLISFLFCVARIVVAVLLVILCPTINIDRGAASWVAYGILVILALVYLALALMLAVKLVEALIRLLGGVGFDRSSHVVDTGLLGVMGLVGCCGQRARRRHKGGRNGRRYQDTSKHDSMSSFSPPTVLGALPASSSHKSIHSGPPSVLKPEHALRPYREESDDETGHIMGAWQPFTSPPTSASSAQYSPVEKSASPKPATGFSKVGGGRAHIDTPYAIASGSTGSTQAFPSFGHQQEPSKTGTSTLNSSRIRVDSDFGETSPVSLMSTTAVRQPEQHALPPGAMSPYHVRTKSQTAVIEHAGPGPSTPLTPVRPPSIGQEPSPPSSFPRRTVDDSAGTPRKKPWYLLRRHRPHSADGSPTSTPAGPEASLDTLSNSSPGRSFVVIRKQPTPRSNAPSLSSGSPMPTPTPTQLTFAKDSSATDATSTP